ncbi:MAG: hybrid sensor histidine kinase/response regulator [Candidatus Bathyarchaeota archaeon]|nr:hybrid sensor histidine kinase/response regulator [Candidatus Bathyarchaeota archaeon]
MSGQTTSHPSDKILVLHVDDDPSVLEVSRQILESEGKFRVEAASSVEDALQKIGTQPFEAIISDYEMPGKDGLQFLEELRQQKNEIAFVMFTGRGREEVAVRALNLGADRYINKNGDPEAVYCELGYAISKIVERKKAKRMIVNDAKRIIELNEKLRVVGSLTRHDVRNKLVSLSGHVFLLKKKLEQNPDLAKHVSEIEFASKQIVELLEFAQLYEKLGAEELTYLEVEKYVNDAAALFPDFKNIRLINQCQGLVVLADSLLRQLFYNLIENTMKHGGNVTSIRFRYEVDDSQIKLIYEDDGVGIPDALRKELFEERTSRGINHGLYVVSRICEAYNWAVKETGKTGEGAQFTVYLPRQLVKDSAAQH